MEAQNRFEFCQSQKSVFQISLNFSFLSPSNQRGQEAWRTPSPALRPGLIPEAAHPEPRASTSPALAPPLARWRAASAPPRRAPPSRPPLGCAWRQQDGGAAAGRGGWCAAGGARGGGRPAGPLYVSRVLRGVREAGAGALRTRVSGEPGPGRGAPDWAEGNGAEGRGLRREGLGLRGAGGGCLGPKWPLRGGLPKTRGSCLLPSKNPALLRSSRCVPSGLSAPPARVSVAKPRRGSALESRRFPGGVRAYVAPRV